MARTLKWISKHQKKFLSKFLQNKVCVLWVALKEKIKAKGKNKEHPAKTTVFPSQHQSLCSVRLFQTQVRKNPGMVCWTLISVDHPHDVRHQPGASLFPNETSENSFPLTEFNACYLKAHDCHFLSPLCVCLISLSPLKPFHHLSLATTVFYKSGLERAHNSCSLHQKSLIIIDKNYR